MKLPSPEEASQHLYQLGREAMERQDYVAATDLLCRSNELYPHFKTLELLGECLLESRKSTEAVTVLAAAAGLGNKASRAYYLLARALHGCGRTQEAIEKLDAAIGLQPDFRAAVEFREVLLNLTRKPS